MFDKIPKNRPLIPLLDCIDEPHQLRNLSQDELPYLANEIRSYLLYCVGQTGGHFGASLGVVELTIVLHYVFNTPYDRIIWDVGHQAYPHKMLTGRRDEFLSLRKQDGLAAFPKRTESPYDAFGVGHSSTSISAALGMALAAKIKKENRQVIAVIGDGAMTAGMAYEALNHAADKKANMLVILNDNDMSISESVGGLSNYLTKILSSRTYHHLRKGSKKVLSAIPHAWELARKTEQQVKGMIIPGTLFQDMGFNYFGPIDGHDLPNLINTINNIKKLKGPRILHIVTCKGKGFIPAEHDPIGYHAITKLEPKPETFKQPRQKKLKYANIFGQWIVDIASSDDRLIGITPAMREGSDLIKFSQLFPERYFDVAIAEQHAVTLSAGMACENLKPIVAIYSTFLQRGYDQLIHDVAVQNLDVLFAIDRAGMVGEDGPTHGGCYDIAYLRCIPNMLIMTPCDENELYRLLCTGYYFKGPASVRYPRGVGPGICINSTLPIEIGQSETRKQGRNIAILAFGTILNNAILAAETLNATLINMRFVKPLDTKVIDTILFTHRYIITIEEASIMGSSGSAVNEYIVQKPHNNIAILNLGIKDGYIEAATHHEQLKSCGLDEQSILYKIKQFIAKN